MTDPVRAQLRERLQKAAQEHENTARACSVETDNLYRSVWQKRWQESAALLREAISRLGEPEAPALFQRKLAGELQALKSEAWQLAHRLKLQREPQLLRVGEAAEIASCLEGLYFYGREVYEAGTKKPDDDWADSDGSYRWCPMCGKQSCEHRGSGPIPAWKKPAESPVSAREPKPPYVREDWDDADRKSADASPLVRTSPFWDPAWAHRLLATQDKNPETRGGNQAAVERLQSAAASPEVLSARDAGDNVLSLPMAAALLLQLKAECEAQYSRAETAESELAVERALCQSWRTRALEYLADLNALRVSHDHHPTASETERASKP